MFAIGVTVELAEGIIGVLNLSLTKYFNQQACQRSISVKSEALA